MMFFVFCLFPKLSDSFIVFVLTSLPLLATPMRIHGVQLLSVLTDQPKGKFH